MEAAHSVFLGDSNAAGHAMLTHLSVRDFAVVEQLELELSGGMNVVTGETGAGKSILLDALGLTLGNRSDADFVAPGATRAEVVACFDVPAATGDATRDGIGAGAWLAERELTGDEGSEVLLRRTISRDGRSRAYINGVPTTVAELRSLGNLLIDIHAQHEHQSLLKTDVHRRLLDEFGGHMELARTVSGIAADYADILGRRRSMLDTAEEQSAERQLLVYQAEELDALDLQPDEAGTLEVTRRELAGADALLRTGQSVGSALTDGEPAVSDLLQRAVAELAALGQPKLEPVVDMLESGRIQIEEAAADLARYLESIEVDPARLQEIESRLDTLYSVARKHQVQPDELGPLHES
ncbi:MAG: DNA repair protein RecN, partial [Gammaproteobacteria bacterium]|nr:DNA repair protein RecN [Gammaproteobacteria bacterium]